MRNKLIAALLLGAPLLAAGGDADAPLTVEAESMEADRAQEISVFTGSVRVEKDSIRILADEVRLRSRDGEVQEGTLIGSPVKFRQHPEGAELIEGEAQRVEYDAVNRVVELTGRAWVRQGSDEFRGETIRYDLDGQRVVATSDRSVPERVRIIFQPRSQTNQQGN